jgi:hypothetical protein
MPASAGSDLIAGLEGLLHPSRIACGHDSRGHAYGSEVMRIVATPWTAIATGVWCALVLRILGQSAPEDAGVDTALARSWAQAVLMFPPMILLVFGWRQPRWGSREWFKRTHSQGFYWLGGLVATSLWLGLI